MGGSERSVRRGIGKRRKRRPIKDKNAMKRKKVQELMKLLVSSSSEDSNSSSSSEDSN